MVASKRRGTAQRDFIKIAKKILKAAPRHPHQFHEKRGALLLVNAPSAPFKRGRAPRRGK